MPQTPPKPATLAPRPPDRRADARRERARAVGKSLAVAGGLLAAGAGTASIAGFVAAPAPVPASLDHIESIRLDGIGRRDNSGFAVSDAGDVDGDGRGDILVGAYAAAPGGKKFAGETTLLFGHALTGDESAHALHLGRLAPGQGIRIAGRDAHDRSGVAIARAGDVDGDGLDDILVGAHFADRNGVPLAGETTLVFGRTLRDAAGDGRTALDLGELAPHEAVVIAGPPGTHRTGWSVASAGDVDADGLADVVIGGHPREGLPGKGAVVFGSALSAASEGSGLVDLAALSSSQGVVLNGIAADDFAGLEVASAGDVDADGHADVLVGAFGTGRDGQERAGAAHLVSGGAIASASRAGATRIDLSQLGPADRTLLAGRAAGDAAGRAVAGAGDVDGDGRADVLVGAWSAAPGGKRWCGEVTLLFGSALLAAAGPDDEGIVDLGSLPETGGIVIRGAAPEDFTGWSVAAAGDVDGDGLGDVVVGAYGVDPSGAAYVLFGAALAERVRSGKDRTVDLAHLAAADGVRIVGALPGSNTGFRVSSAGDVDGDGLADVLLGAPNADLPAGREAAGQSFVVGGAAITAASAAGGVLDLGAIHPAPPEVGAASSDAAPGRG